MSTNPQPEDRHQLMPVEVVEIRGRARDPMAGLVEMLLPIRSRVCTGCVALGVAAMISFVLVVLFNGDAGGTSAVTQGAIPVCFAVVFWSLLGLILVAPMGFHALSFTQWWQAVAAWGGVTLLLTGFAVSLVKLFGMAGENAPSLALNSALALAFSLALFIGFGLWGARGWDNRNRAHTTTHQYHRPVYGAPQVRHDVRPSFVQASTVQAPGTAVYYAYQALVEAAEMIPGLGKNWASWKAQLDAALVNKNIETAMQLIQTQEQFAAAVRAQELATGEHQRTIIKLQIKLVELRLELENTVPQTPSSRAARREDRASRLDHDQELRTMHADHKQRLMDELYRRKEATKKKYQNDPDLRQHALDYLDLLYKREVDEDFGESRKKKKR